MDDDGGGFFNMFGDDEEEKDLSTQKTEEVKVPEPVLPTKKKHDGCILEDPVGARVRVKYEGELFSASIKSYQPDSDTYTIIWTSSGVLQYRTKPEDINWEAFEEEIAKKEEKKPEQDELWLAARRGDLDAVKTFITNGVDYNETGKSQQRTPFYHAVFCGHVNIVEYLMSLGATDADGTAFIVANTQVREIMNSHGQGRRKNSVRKSVTSRPYDFSEIQAQLSPSQLESFKILEERLRSVEVASGVTRRVSVLQPRKQSQQEEQQATQNKVTFATTKEGDNLNEEKQDALKDKLSRKQRASMRGKVKFGEGHDSPLQVEEIMIRRRSRPRTLFTRLLFSFIPKSFRRSTKG